MKVRYINIFLFIVIGLVIAAAVGMQVYVKRSLQAKIKNAVDFNDPQAADQIEGLGGSIAGAGTANDLQYEPYYASQAIVATRTGTTQAQTLAGGAVDRTIIAPEVSTRTGTQTQEAASGVPLDQ